MHFKASIIIPLLHQVDAWLTKAVVSALDQTEMCEVLVVTSPATPDSNLTILQRLSVEWPNLRILRQRPGEQFAAAMNLGIREATADRIGFLMSDDWLHTGAVAACIAHGEDIVSTGRTFYAADGTTELRELAEIHTEQAYRKLRTMVGRATFLHHFFLLRKASLERAGGLDETIGNSPGVDDFDLIWTLLEQGATASIISESFYCYRDHEDMRLTKKNPAEMLTTFERILDKHSLLGSERKKILLEHSPWFGTSMWTRYRELTSTIPMPLLLRPLQRMYRGVIPLRTRISIHKRFLRRDGDRTKRY